jgi:hypothetical protein
MPFLLFPIGLAALTAVLIPLAIHLARRTEQRPMDFAALRWLRQKPRPRHRPRFDEWLLLAVRLILLVLVALFLARPAVRDGGHTRPMVAVAPGVDARTLGAGEERRVWLAPGFPPLDVKPPARVPLGSLIRQLDAELPQGAALTLVVPAVIDGADAERPRLARRVTWRVVPGTMVAGTPVRRRVRVALNAPNRYIRAAVAALGWTPAATDPLPKDTAALIWLAPGALPPVITRWIEAGGAALVGHETIVPTGSAAAVWQGGEGETLVEERVVGAGRVLRFTRALTPAAMPALTEADFPERLATLLLAPSPAPARTSAQAYRPVTGGAAPTPGARDLRPWLALAIAVLWLVERWLATRSRRAVAP